MGYMLHVSSESNPKNLNDQKLFQKLEARFTSYAQILDWAEGGNSENAFYIRREYQTVHEMRCKTSR